MSDTEKERDSWGMIQQSPGHVAFAIFLMFLAIASLAVTCRHAGFFVAGVTDVYLALLIWIAVCKSSNRTKRPFDLDVPYRGPALWVLLFALTSLVCATAATYPEVGYASPRSLAVYKSFITIAGFSYDISSVAVAWTQASAATAWTQAVQLTGGILLLLVAFPILLSRISWDSSDYTSVVFNGIQIQLPTGSKKAVQVTGNEFTWSGHKLNFVDAGSEKVVQYVDGSGATKNLTSGGVIKLNADGTCSPTG